MFFIAAANPIAWFLLPWRPSVTIKQLGVILISLLIIDFNDLISL